MVNTKNLVPGMRKIRYNFHSISGLLLITFVIAIVSLKGDIRRILKLQTIPNDSIPHCDLFFGKWVYDNISYPLYNDKQCSFMEGAFACEKYGRKDLNYQKWRWQPHDCDLPRFNATALLEKLRGKNLTFVGDSLNRNQWISMLCLIESSIPPSSSKSVVWKGNSFIFKITDYNATINFYWSPFLVESNCDDIINHRVGSCAVRVKAIEKHARHWTDADILVFDSFAWWLEPKMTLIPDGIYKQGEMKLRGYEMALNTWSDWLDIHINRTRTKLFFMSLSPFHSLGGDWSMDTGTGQNCYTETEPILYKGYQGSQTDHEMMQIVESTIHELGTRGLKVGYLNITQLSDYRKDAHPSVYREFWEPLTEEKLADPKRYSDCLHWCLPGLPDVWNFILYSYIMRS